MRRLLLTMVVFLIIGVIILSTQDSGYRAEITRDVPYAVGVIDSPRQQLDLYLPVGAADFPVLMFVPGGGWTAGSKDDLENLGRMFVRQGIGVVTVDYRLAPEVDYTGQVADLAEAFAWIQENIARYGGDPSRVVIGGHSSGGHLVALLATDPQYLDPLGYSADDLTGVLTLSAMMQIDGRTFSGSGMMLPDDSAAPDASPLTHVRAGLPPFLLLAAEDDFPEILAQTDAMRDALAAADVPVQAVTIASRDHFNILSGIGAGDLDVTTTMLRWLREQFGL